MVVYGTRKERDVIQEIIEVLDAEDLPDSLTTPSPELIQIENSSADRILKILESVYSNQLTSGGGRRTVEIPEGVTTAVASMLQQINAATTGPILTLGMDENTNSIVMRAPMELGREIKTFCRKTRLDSESFSGQKNTRSENGGDQRGKSPVNLKRHDQRPLVNSHNVPRMNLSRRLPHGVKKVERTF